MMYLRMMHVKVQQLFHRIQRYSVVHCLVLHPILMRIMSEHTPVMALIGTLEVCGSN